MDGDGSGGPGWRVGRVGRFDILDARNRQVQCRGPGPVFVSCSHRQRREAWQRLGGARPGRIKGSARAAHPALIAGPAAGAATATGRGAAHLAAACGTGRRHRQRTRHQPQQHAHGRDPADRPRRVHRSAHPTTPPSTQPKHTERSATRGRPGVGLAGTRSLRPATAKYAVQAQRRSSLPRPAAKERRLAGAVRDRPANPTPGRPSPPGALSALSLEHRGDGCRRPRW